MRVPGPLRAERLPRRLAESVAAPLLELEPGRAVVVERGEAVGVDEDEDEEGGAIVAALDAPLLLLETCQRRRLRPPCVVLLSLVRAEGDKSKRKSKGKRFVRERETEEG